MNCCYRHHHFFGARHRDRHTKIPLPLTADKKCGLDDFEVDGLTDGNKAQISDLMADDASQASHVPPLRTVGYKQVCTVHIGYMFHSYDLKPQLRRQRKDQIASQLDHIADDHDHISVLPFILYLSVGCRSLSLLRSERNARTRGFVKPESRRG